MPDPPFERFGRYVLVESLGHGATGRVDLALTLDPGGCPRFVVLKRVRTEKDEDGYLVRMFVKEARLSAQFAHPNLVSVIGVEQDDDQIAIVMEHLDGHSLDDLFREHTANGTRTPPGIAIHIVGDALRGLHCAHTLTDYDGRPLDLVHRDFTPQNIFVTRDGRAKVLDFGIAKLSGAGTRTGTGLVKGKLGYMAPEQILALPLDRRTDVFAAAVVLWELLAGRRLGRSKSISDVVLQADEPLPPLHEVAPWVDDELSAIVARAAAIVVDARYPSAVAFEQALDAYAAGNGLVATPQEVAAHLDALLGAETRARDERVRSRYPGALQALAASPSEPPEPPAISTDSTLQLQPRSDAPIVTESHPGARGSRRSIQKAAAFLGLLAMVAASLAALRAQGPLDPAARAAAERTPPPAKVVHDARWEALRLAPAPRPPRAAPRAPRPRANPPTPPPAATSSPGFLTLDTYPWTNVTIDGHPLGATPLVRVPLPPGGHMVRVETDDRRLAREIEVHVSSGEVTVRRWGLE